MTKRSIVFVGGSRRVIFRDSNGRFVAAKKDSASAPAKKAAPAKKSTPAKKAAPAKKAPSKTSKSA